MTLLDAYAVVAFLAGGPAAADVRAILRQGNTAIATVNLAEALDVSERVFGVRTDVSAAALEPLLDSAVATLPLDVETARRAAEIRAGHYHRSSCPISLADAVLIASARPGDRIATSDPDVLRVAAIERIDTVALPAQG